MLIDNKANLNTPDNSGITALNLAAKSSQINMNILRLLGDNGADVNIKENTWGYSALLWAAKANNY